MTALTDAPTPTEADVAEFRQLHPRLGDAVEAAVHGKRDRVDLVLVAVFAGGHVLLEDVPGTGKTTLARAVAPGAGRSVAARAVHPGPAAQRRHRHLGLRPARRPDPVPAGTGVRQRRARRRDQPGRGQDPVGAAGGDGGADGHRRRRDPSRARPVPGDRHAEPDRPRRHLPAARGAAGPVPDPDRRSGYPDAEHEIEVLRPGSTAGRCREVRTRHHARRGGDDDPAARDAARGRPAAALRPRDRRRHPRATRAVRLGASTRGLRALVRCLQVYAAAQGRHYVVPSDVQRLAEPVLAHRTVLTRDAVLAGHTPVSVVHDVLESVPPPQPDGALSRHDVGSGGAAVTTRGWLVGGLGVALLALGIGLHYPLVGGVGVALLVVLAAEVVGRGRDPGHRGPPRR